MRLTVLWINDSEARLTHFCEQEMVRELVGGEAFFWGRVVSSLCESRRILLLGPKANLESFRYYLSENHAELFSRVEGIEVVELPHDSVIAAFALKYLLRRAG